MADYPQTCMLQFLLINGCQYINYIVLLIKIKTDKDTAKLHYIEVLRIFHNFISTTTPDL